MATVAWAVAMAVVTVATVTAAPALYAVEDTGPTASTEKFLVYSLHLSILLALSQFSSYEKFLNVFKNTFKLFKISK